MANEKYERDNSNRTAARQVMPKLSIPYSSFFTVIDAGQTFFGYEVQDPGIITNLTVSLGKVPIGKYEIEARLDTRSSGDVIIKPKEVVVGTIDFGTFTVKAGDRLSLTLKGVNGSEESLVAVWVTFRFTHE